MRGAQFAIAFDVPFLQEVGEALVTVLHAFRLRDAAKDLTILFVRRIANLDLVTDAAQKVVRAAIGGGKN